MRSQSASASDSGSLRRLVLHDLDREEVAHAADVADDRDVLEALEQLARLRLVVEDVLEDALALVDLDRAERDRRADRDGRRR